MPAETGIKALDSDLAVLLGLDGEAVKERLARLPSKAETPLADIVSIVPTGALRVAATLLDESKFERLKAGIRPEALPDLEEARRVASAFFPRVVTIPSVKRALARGESRARAREKLAEKVARAPQIAAGSYWEMGSNQLLRPGIRFVFGSADGNEILLDVRLDWEQTIDIARQFMTTVLGDIEDAKASKSPLDIERLASDFVRIRESLSEIASSVSSIDTLMHDIESAFGQHADAGRKDE